MWDVQSGEKSFEFTPELPVRDILFDPSGRMIFTQTLGGRVRSWDAQTGNNLEFVPDENPFAPPTNTQNVSSPDGDFILTTTGSTRPVVHLIDATTGEELLQFIGHTDFVIREMFSPDGYTVLTASYDGTVRLWDISDLVDAP